MKTWAKIRPTSDSLQTGAVDYWALILSVIVGVVLVLGFAWITASVYSSPIYPVIALISGFVVTGAIIGVVSKGVTIIEPGVGAVVVALIAALIIPPIELPGFAGVSGSTWIIIFLNGIIATFFGAWLGEQLQHGSLDEMLKDDFIEWEWAVAGSFLGIVLAIVTINVLVLFFGPDSSKFYIPFFVSLIFTGILIGWKSPGVTIREAGVAGLLTIVAFLDVVKLIGLFEPSWAGLIPQNQLMLGGGIVVGVALAYIGGYIGERIQGSDI